MTGQDIMTSFNPYNQSHLMGKALIVIGVVVVVIKRKNAIWYGISNSNVMMNTYKKI
jgi:hypothetical protein